MGGYLSIPVLFLTVIIQATVMPELRVGGGEPDLVFLVVMSVALMAGLRQGIVWAIVGGVLQDLISAVPMGTTALALVVTVALAGVIVGRISPRSLFYPPLVAAIGTLVLHVVTMTVLVVTGRPLPFLDLLAYVTLPAIVYNTGMMLVIYRVVGSFYLSSRPRRVAGL